MKEKAGKYLQIFSFAQFYIVWNDGNHWEIVGEKSSPFGKIGKLHQVCWIEFSREKNHIPAGNYRVVWRMRFTSPLHKTNFSGKWRITVNQVG